MISLTKKAPEDYKNLLLEINILHAFKVINGLKFWRLQLNKILTLFPLVDFFSSNFSFIFSILDRHT